MAQKTPELEIDVTEVVDYLKLNGGFAAALGEVVKRKITADAAKKHRIKVTTKELQKAADVFRIDSGLYKASEMQNWLKSNGLSVEAFEEYLETSLLVAKFKHALVTKVKPGKYLASAPIKDAVREMAYQDWFAKAAK